MSKKLILEFVKEKIEIMHPGCQVLTTEYINSKEKLDIICEHGHKFETAWNSIKNKQWCNECHKEKLREKFQFDYNYVKQYIQNTHPGSKLLSTKYKNSKTKLKILCENNHIFYQSLVSTKNNKTWCPECYGNKKNNIEYVKKEIEKMHLKCKVLSQEYINSKTKLDIICENGHNIQMCWGDIKQKYWCLECCGNKKYTIDDIREYLKDNYPKAKLLSTKYINNKCKLHILCEKGHEIITNFNSIQQKLKCAECSGNKKHTIEKVNAYIKLHHPEAKILDINYINSITKLNIICENNHIIKIPFKSILKGHWCNECKKGKGESLCAEIFEEIFNKKFIKIRPKWLRNPKTGYPLELDGFNEELKIAFEYNGEQHYKKTNHFHKTEKQFNDQQYRDSVKHEICKEKQITLLKIKQFINYDHKSIKSKILDEINKHPRLINLIKLSSSQLSLPNL